MTQRSYSNERYRKDAKIGSTRKSAAKAKPIRKQGVATSSVEKPKAKAKKDGVEKDWAGLPTSPQIKKWRRIWWVLLVGGLALIGGTYAIPELRGNEEAARVVSLIVVVLSAAAVTIDLVVIRKLRKELILSMDKKAAKAEAAKADAKAAKAGASGKGKTKASTSTDDAPSGGKDDS